MEGNLGCHPSGANHPAFWVSLAGYSSPIRLRRLASMLQRSACLHLPSSGIINTGHAPSCSRLLDSGSYAYESGTLCQLSHLPSIHSTFQVKRGAANFLENHLRFTKRAGLQGGLQGMYHGGCGRGCSEIMRALGASLSKHSQSCDNLSSCPSCRA